MIKGKKFFKIDAFIIVEEKGSIRRCVEREDNKDAVKKLFKKDVFDKHCS